MGKWLTGGLAGLGIVGFVGWRFLHREQVTFPMPDSLVMEPEVELDLRRLPDGTFRLVWGTATPPVAVYGGMAPDTIDMETPLDFVAEGDALVLTGIDTETRPYLAVRLEGGETIITAERTLAIDGGVNFRDVGGYRTEDGRRVRWGRVYRSGMLGELTPTGIRQLETLKIRLVCDLRGEDEAQSVPDRLPETDSPTLLHMPLADESNRWGQLKMIVFDRHKLDGELIKMYTEIMLDRNAGLYGLILRQLADEDNLPAVLHCTAGKDRTGVAVALLLLTLGVPEDVVVADYTLSNHAYAHFRRFVGESVRRVAWMGIKVDHLQPLMSANPATMRGAIQHIKERYGSVEGYLHDAAGVDTHTIERLKHLMLT